MLKRLIQSFYFAFCGLFFLFRTQRNARIELSIGILACIAGIYFHLSPAEWSVLVLTIACVLILEGLNTAIENAVDLASPEIHPKAKIAKDLAAGMVLIAAIASIFVGAFLFLPRIIRLLVEWNHHAGG